MKYILYQFMFLLICLKVSAQTEEATTQSGKKVILYSNGTWKYATTDPKVSEKDGKKKEPEKKSSPEPIALSGDCSENLENIEDTRTRIVTTRTKNLIIIAEKNDRKEITISMQRGAKDVISIVFHPVGAGQCVGEGNNIIIFFTDGSRLDLINDFTNCKGESTASLGGNYGRKKALSDLQSKKIKSIKIFTEEGFVLQNLSSANQEEFQQILNCLSKQ